MEGKESVLVWDLGVRLFHWLNLAGFFVAYLTTQTMFLPIHIWSGYLVLTLVVFRIMWGFVGSKHARFRDFVYPPVTVLTNLKEIILLRPKQYLGHSPAAGAMVILLLLGLLATAVTGAMLQGAEQHAGLLAGSMSGLDKNSLKSLHGLATNVTLALVWVHVIGAIFSSVTRNDDLVGAMLTGRKRV